MAHSLSRKHPILWLYLFFLYFPLSYQVLVFSSGMSGTVGLRQSILMSILWLIPVLIFPTKVKPIAAVIGIILWGSAMVGLGYWLIYGQDFSQSAIFIIFETNIAEGSEFVGSYFKWWHGLVFLTFTAIPLWMWKKIVAIEVSPGYRYQLATVFSIIAFWPFINTLLIKGQSAADSRYHQLIRMEPAAPWNLIVGYIKYSEQLSAMQTLLTANEHLSPLTGFSEETPDHTKTMVLVIGESTNRQRMSLYGYSRNTTPRLDSLKGELTVFDDVITPRPYTIEALQQVLSFADQNNPQAFFTRPTLLNMMRQAGYEITWITNQQTQTKRNTMLTTLSQLADKQVYLNNNRAQNASQYDGLVLDPFTQALNSKARKKVIIVHLLGTHRKYSFRYPEEFNQFTTKQGAPDWIDEAHLEEYNSYDNSILYNDYVVAELIERLREKEGHNTFIYLSDHGEEVYDTPDNLFTGRNEGKPRASMYTVPFILWTSEGYQQENSTDSWKRYTDRSYSSADFIYTWADIAGINFKGMDFTRSLVSPQFTESSRLIGDPNNPKFLRDYSTIISNPSSLVPISMKETSLSGIRPESNGIKPLSVTY